MRQTRRIKAIPVNALESLIQTLYESATRCPEEVGAALRGENSSCLPLSRLGQTGSGQDIILCNKGLIYKGFPTSRNQIKASRVDACDHAGTVVALPPWGINLLFQTVIKYLIKERAKRLSAAEEATNSSPKLVRFNMLLEKYTCLCTPSTDRTTLFLGGELFGYPVMTIFAKIREYVGRRYEREPDVAKREKRVSEMMTAISSEFNDLKVSEEKNGQYVDLGKSMVSAETFLMFFRKYLDSVRWKLIKTGITESEARSRCVGTESQDGRCRDSYLFREQTAIISTYVADCIRNWFESTSVLLRWLHSEVQFHHADPKAAQLFLTQDGTAVLGDFDKVSFTLNEDEQPIRIVVASKAQSVAGQLSRKFANEALARRYDCRGRTTPIYEEMAFLVSMLVIIGNESVFDNLFLDTDLLSVQSPQWSGRSLLREKNIPVRDIMNITKLHQKLFSYKRITGKRGFRPLSLGTPAKLTQSVLRKDGKQNWPAESLASTVSVQNLRNLTSQFVKDPTYQTCNKISKRRAKTRRSGGVRNKRNTRKSR
tara:strand:- start:657 stop:2279 length:1623 start_codon:yes stop_codon:yes gene_type:complete